MSIEEYSEKVRKEYEAHLEKHDPNSPEAVHWIGRNKTWLRFKILTEIDDLNGKKILDFGCGNALLLDFLKENDINCEYYGWDVSEKMIKVANSRHSNVNFKVVDILKDDLNEFNNFFDYIIISGVFNLKVSTKEDIHKKWAEKILLKLWGLCKKGLAMNFMTEHVDWRDSELYYCSINEITSFCVKNLSRWFTIRHDYQLWEFTIYLYKEPKVRL
ncbi:MAG: class I SAM-dependent methyltransferase [Candidatus Jordarchaeaceae archaeon]